MIEGAFNCLRLVICSPWAIKVELGYSCPTSLPMLTQVIVSHWKSQVALAREAYLLLLKNVYHRVCFAMEVWISIEVSWSLKGTRSVRCILLRLQV